MFDYLNMEATILKIKTHRNEWTPDILVIDFTLLSR